MNAALVLSGRARLGGGWSAMTLVAAGIAIVACDDHDVGRVDGDAGDVNAPAELGAEDAPMAVDAAGDSLEAADAPDASAAAEAGAEALASGCQVPCLAAIARDCMPAGACLEENGNVRRYDNGFMACTGGFSSVHTGHFNSSITYYRPGGARCFTLDYASSRDALPWFTWKDGAGNLVASGTLDAKGKPVVFCGDEFYGAAPLSTCWVAHTLPPTSTVERFASPIPCTAGVDAGHCGP